MSSSTNVGNIDLGLSVNKQMFNKQLNGIASSAKSSVMSALKPLGKMMGAVLGGAAIAGFTKSCISLGSNLSEVQNVVDVTFKSMSSSVDSFAKNAMTQFGLSETVAKKYTGTFGAMSKAMGLSESAAYEMSTAVTGLTGDVASFYNLSTDEAYTKLKSIWTGETETLKDLGVVMTQTALDNYALNNGFGKTTKQMSEQEKLMLRYQYVMSSLSGAQGDFVRTQDSWANQTRVLQLQFESLKATLGQGFINVFTPILKALNLLLGKLQIAANAFKSFTAGLMNKNGIEKAISGGVSEAAALGAGISDAGDNAVSAAQKAKKALAGFDEINTLSFGDDSQSSSAAVADTGISAGSMDLSGVDEANSAVDSMAEKMGIKLRGVISSAGDFFKRTFTALKNWGSVNFAPIFNGIFEGLSQNASTLMQTLSGVFSDIQSLGEPLKAYFAGDFTAYLQAVFTNLGLIVNGLFDTFNMVFSDIWNIAVFPMLESFILYGLPVITQFATECCNTLGTWFTTVKKIFDMLWSEGVAPVLELISKIWSDLMQSISKFWNKWGAPIFDNFRTAITKTGDTMQNVWHKFLKPVWDKIMETIDIIWTDHLRPLVDNFLDFVGEFVNGALEIYNKFISPVVNWFVDKFGPPISRVINTIIEHIGKIVGHVIDAVNGVITHLKGIVQFITGVFTGDWDKAWQGIKNQFKGVWDSLVSIVKIPIDMIIGAVSTLISVVKEKLTGIIDFVKGVFTYDWGNVWQKIKEVFSNVWNSFTEIAKTPINAIIGFINQMISSAIEGINCLIRAVNTISFDIPDWVPGIGGNHFGFDFGEFTAPQIPYLAKGGLAYSPTLAMIGDNKNARTDPEVVAPLSKLKEIIGQNGNYGNESAYSGLVSAIKSGLKGIIDSIKNVLSVDIPGSVYIQNTNIPETPHLAKVGLAYQPPLAMIGDNKNTGRTDSEVDSPLSKLQGIIGQNSSAGSDRIYELLTKIYELLRQLDLVAQFNIDGRMLEEVIVSLLNKRSFITNGR